MFGQTAEDFGLCALPLFVRGRSFPEGHLLGLYWISAEQKVDILGDFGRGWENVFVVFLQVYFCLTTLRQCGFEILVLP